MENEIEENLKEKYAGVIRVKFLEYRIYNVEIVFSFNKFIDLNFLYDARLTFDGNLKNLCEKIDKEIANLYKVIKV